MRVLVTGGSGFIGQHTCKALQKAGHEVHALVRASSDTSVISSRNIRIHRLGSETLDDITKGLRCESIIHCANAYGRDSKSIRSVFDVNLRMPIEMIESCIPFGLKSFIYLDTCFPVSYPFLRNYTLSKKQMVQWGKHLSEDLSFQFLNLQLQHPFGPGDREGKFVPWFINQCRTKDTIELTEGTQKKDLFFVEDAADAIVTLINASQTFPSGFQQFECGRGESVSIRSFCQQVHAAMNSSATLNFGAIPMRDGEVMNSVANITKLTDLGWHPRHSLDSAIRKTLNPSTR